MIFMYNKYKQTNGRSCQEFTVSSGFACNCRNNSSRFRNTILIKLARDFAGFVYANTNKPKMQITIDRHINLCDPCLRFRFLV